MTRRTARRRTKRPDGRQRGYILVWFAAMMVVLLAFAGFAVDLGYWYLEGRNAQRTADAAALSGVVYREGDISNNDAARDAALATATENGYNTAADDTDVTVHFDDASGDSLPLNQLRVEVERKAPSFFTRVLGFNGVDMSRDAVAEYEPPPPLGSPSNVLGNEGLLQSEIDGGGSWNSLPEDDRIDQSLWLDIHGTRTQTAHGDQYQTDNCKPAWIPQPTGNLFFYAQPCEVSADGTTNQDYVGGGLGAGVPGRDGYSYVIEVDDPEVGETIDVQIFDPAFLDQGTDCRDWPIRESASPAIGYGTSAITVLGFPIDVVNAPIGLRNAPIQLRTGFFVPRALPALYGNVSQIAQLSLDLLQGPPPPVPNGFSPLGTVTKYNYWATLQNYGVTETELEDAIERFKDGPDTVAEPRPTCTGDTRLQANLSLFPCIPPFCGGGGGGLPPWLGGSSDSPTDVTPAPLANPGDVSTGPPGSFDSSGDPPPAVPLADPGAVAAKPTSVPAAAPLRPARSDMTGYDGLPETQFAISDSRGSVTQHDDDIVATDPLFPGGPVTDCVDTYGWYSSWAPNPVGYTAWSELLGNTGYWWNWLFNGDHSEYLGFPFGISLGTITYGFDITSAAPYDSPPVTKNYGHAFRETARQWVDHCSITITDDLIHNGKVQLLLNARTNVRDNGVTSQACNSATSTCGKGANRFSLRAQRRGGILGTTGNEVSVYADQRMAVMGNFLDPTGGDFWLSKVLENSSRDRVLKASFFDPGDIAVCADADGDGVPDSASGDDCSPAGYGNNVHGTLSIMQPDGDASGSTPFPSCSYAVYGQAEQTVSPCVIDVLDSDLNGKVLELKIPIASASYSCDGDPDTNPTACWIRSRFQWSDPGSGYVIRPEDVTTWTVELEGVPVRLVE